VTQASNATPSDGRGSDLSRRYRQLPVDNVPADLDRLILEHARAVVNAPDAPHRTWIRWGLPLGLVGSALLAATLVLDGVRPQQPESIPDTLPPSDVTSPGRAELPMSSAIQSAPAPANPAADPPASARAEPVAAMPVRRLETAVVARTSPAVAVISTAPSPPRAAEVTPEPVAPEPVIDSSTRATDAAPEEPLQQAADAASLASTASQSPYEELGMLQLNTPNSEKRAAAESRLEEIRYLRETGRNRRANYEWRKFLEDFPNYPVAAEDSARPRAQ
jgi:hypothetical protein